MSSKGGMSFPKTLPPQHAFAATNRNVSMVIISFALSLALLVVVLARRSTATLVRTPCKEGEPCRQIMLAKVYFLSFPNRKHFYTALNFESFSVKVGLLLEVDLNAPSLYCHVLGN